MRPGCSTLIIVFVTAIAASPAFAVKRHLLKQIRSDYARHTYQLRADLRDDRFPVAPNVLDENGLRHQGPDLRVLFYQLETVFLDRISNEGAKSVTLTLYRSRTEAEEVRQLAPSSPLSVGADPWRSHAGFLYRFGTSVTLELTADKGDPIAQRGQITALLNKLFYLKETPTHRDREAFILSHPNLPTLKLAEVSGFSEEVVRVILGSRNED